MLDTVKIATALLFTVLLTSANANAAEIVIKKPGNLVFNKIEFKRVEYVGQCPGVVVSQIGGKARFTSSSTLPVPGRVFCS